MGSNSGPAGGAYWGLRLLFEEGWDWVLWVDDDDAPSFPGQVHHIFEILQKRNDYSQIGIIGSNGGYFDKTTSSLKRIHTEHLEGILEVDWIAGNQFPMINRRVFESGLLPNPDLFFGFEDLEFCLRVRKSGLKILVDGSVILNLRKKFGRLHQHKTLRYIPKVDTTLWREYYSTRTISYILKNSTRNRSGQLFYFLKCLLKMAGGFMYGLSYGKVNAQYILQGFMDGVKNKLGEQVLPNKKY